MARRWTLRSAMFPALALVPLTAGSCVAVWATWPALQPLSTAAANPHATTAAGTRELRRLKGFTGASCSADEATWRAESRWSRRFDYAE